MSTLCGILCLLLIALWVRSVWTLDEISIRLTGARYVSFWSIPSSCRINIVDSSLSTPWSHHTTSAWSTLAAPAATFGYHNGELWWPHWFAVSLLGAIGAVPWIKWRFSLRTLILATTLVAVVLGLLVAMR
jgi:hypothetical protein